MFHISNFGFEITNQVHIQVHNYWLQPVRKKTACHTWSVLNEQFEMQNNS